MADDHCVSLPTGCTAQFVGEGAANVVFAIHVPGNPDEYRKKLLRVPKDGTNAYPYEEIQAYWRQMVRPKFQAEDLVHQSLVDLSSSGIAEQLGQVLAGEDPGRRGDFKGSRVENARYGMLVEDMRAGEGELVLEFKPKWLAQSPNAPESAVRCRNCAREASRNNKLNRTDPILCPLDLLSTEDKEAQTRVLEHLVPGTASFSQRMVFQTWLRKNDLLPRLRHHQVENDPDGPLKASALDPRFQLAMTIRDCTCFVRIPATPVLKGNQPEGRPEAKLADLDKKNWEVKLDYWRSTEEKLARDGYYAAKETPRQHTECQLEGRGRKGPERSVTAEDVL